MAIGNTDERQEQKKSMLVSLCYLKIRKRIKKFRNSLYGISSTKTFNARYALLKVKSR